MNQISENFRKLQEEYSELDKKQAQSRTVLQTARTKITQQKEQIDRLTAENVEFKRRLSDTTQISKGLAIRFLFSPLSDTLTLKAVTEIKYYYPSVAE